jgi:hypothetical protein
MSSSMLPSLYSYSMASYRSSVMIGMASMRVMRTVGGRSILVDGFWRFLIQFNLAFDFCPSGVVFTYRGRRERDKNFRHMISTALHVDKCTVTSRPLQILSSVGLTSSPFVIPHGWNDVAHPRDKVTDRN